jgi:hypothetical protein
MYIARLVKPIKSIYMLFDGADVYVKARIVYCFVMTNFLHSAGSESPSFGGNTVFPFSKMTLDDMTTGSTSPRILSNEISAPYEVPQFPIEQLEKKLAIQRQLSSR